MMNEAAVLKAIRACVNVNDLDDIEVFVEQEGINGITYLELVKVDGKDLSFLQYLPNLTKLDVTLTKVLHLDEIAKVTKLEVVWLLGVGVKDFSPLTKLTKLRKLGLLSCTIPPMWPLVTIPCLKSLDLSESYPSDLSMFYKPSNIDTLDITDSRVRKSIIRKIHKSITVYNH